jgi:hypothetical protein
MSVLHSCVTPSSSNKAAVQVLRNSEASPVFFLPPRINATDGQTRTGPCGVFETGERKESAKNRNFILVLIFKCLI